VLSALQSVSSDRFYEHVFSADGQLVSSMINRLTDSSEVCDLLLLYPVFLACTDVLTLCYVQPSVASDRSIEFLQSLIPTFDPFAVNSELVAAVDDMVGSMLPLLIGSLQRGGSAIGKLNKVSDFVGWLIQTRPDLCRSRFGGCLTWFVSLADRVLTDLDLSAQQKHLRMSSARLLSQAASVSDDTYVRAMLNRTGMLESVLLMLLSNSGSEGMFGSVVQGMICTMAEHWLNSFLSGRASSLVERFVRLIFVSLQLLLDSSFFLLFSVGPKAVSDSLRQLMFSISSAISRVCDVSDARTVKPSTKPRAMSLQRLNSLELIEIKHAGDREQLVDMGRILPAQVPSVSDGLQVAADAEIRRLRDRCQELDQHNSQLSAERDKICSDSAFICLTFIILIAPLNSALLVLQTTRCRKRFASFVVNSPLSVWRRSPLSLCVASKASRLVV
jgi:hypothetical protein